MADNETPWCDAAAKDSDRLALYPELVAVCGFIYEDTANLVAGALEDVGLDDLVDAALERHTTLVRLRNLLLRAKEIG